MALHLAGALLGRRVPAEQVPALVAEAVLAAGWPRDRIDEFRTAAVDTVRRWADGSPVAGLSALPSEVREAIETATDVRRAELAARAAAPLRSLPVLQDTTRLLEETIRSAPEGLSVIQAGCGLGKTHAARIIAAERAARGGAHKPNTKTAISVDKHELAIQVTADLQAAGIPVLRLFGTNSVKGPYDGFECRFRASAAALAEGGQSARRLYCPTCEYKSECAAQDGQEGPSDARVLVGPHALLAELDAGVGKTGLLFIDEPPLPVDDDVFDLDMLVLAERNLGEHFERRYAAAMAPALRAVSEWTEHGRTRESGPLGRAFEGGIDPELLERAFDATGEVDALENVRVALPEKQTAPPLDSRSVILSRRILPLAQKLGKTSHVLRSIHRALTKPGFSAAVYESAAGRHLAITGVSRVLETALTREGRVIVAAADAGLYLEAYAGVVGYPPAFRQFVAPDGAPIARTMIVTRATRSKWAGEDSAPIENAARWVAAWALEKTETRTVGVVTFQIKKAAVRRALEAAAPAIRWEVGHYGGLRGLDKWKDFDAVCTLGDPRPNLDHVAREIGAVSEDANERQIARSDERAAAELEQAHGRLRTVHRTRPGRALHVGALLPSGWHEPIELRSPPEGRPRRAPAPGIAGLIDAAGGQRATARGLGVHHTTVGRWLTGEGTPNAAQLDALRLAGSERHRPTEDAKGGALTPTYRNIYEGVSAPLNANAVEDAAA
jgi:hypothetical protein